MAIEEGKNNLNHFEMAQSNEWASRVMNGLWKGTGRWEDDDHWKGHGTWNGGLLYGNWDGNGKWKSENDQMGHWSGKGDLICNMSFHNYMPIVSILLFLSVAAIGTITVISIIRFAKEIGLITILFLIIILIALRKTNKGKWQATGTWEDSGDFRILKLQGSWKLGPHKGLFKGEIRDHKPSFLSSSKYS